MDVCMRSFYACPSSGFATGHLSATMSLQYVRKQDSGREDNCVLLGSYAASSGSLLLTFRDNFQVPSSGFKNKQKPVARLRI